MRAALGLALLFAGGTLAYMVLTGHAPFSATSAGVGDVATSGQAGAVSEPTSGASGSGGSGSTSVGGGFGSGGTFK